MGQSKPIYNAFKAIKESSDWHALSDSCKRIVEGMCVKALQFILLMNILLLSMCNECSCGTFYIFIPTYPAQIKEAVLNGIALEDDKREQFNKIEQVST